jgi:hypothetical protein
MSKVSSGETKNMLYCSFCGKSQHEVRKLIAGPTVFICDECVELCMDIIGEENKSSWRSRAMAFRPPRCHSACNFYQLTIAKLPLAKDPPRASRARRSLLAHVDCEWSQ